MSVKSKYICGIRVDEVDKKSALNLAKKLLLADEYHFRWITSINPEKCGRAMENEALRNTINGSIMTIPDGIGIVWAGRINGLLLKHRIPGIDFAWNMIRLVYKYNLKLYLYGAKTESNRCAKTRIEAMMPGINIVGATDGYRDWDEVAKDIAQKRPDLLLIAMGGGKQEEFIWQYKDILPVKVAMGVGGSFDVWAGKVERAPRLWQTIGMEWFYRIAKEPFRIPRLKYGMRFMVCSMHQMLYNM